MVNLYTFFWTIKNVNFFDKVNKNKAISSLNDEIEEIILKLEKEHGFYMLLDKKTLKVEVEIKWNISIDKISEILKNEFN